MARGRKPKVVGVQLALDWTAAANVHEPSEAEVGDDRSRINEEPDPAAANGEEPPRPGQQKKAQHVPKTDGWTEHIDQKRRARKRAASDQPPASS